MSSWIPPAAVHRINVGAPADVTSERADMLRRVDQLRRQWIAEHPNADPDDPGADPAYTATVTKILAGT